MGVEFTEKEILLIYSLFKRELKNYEELKNMPSCPVDKKTINREIKMNSAITKKIEVAYPALLKLNM